MKINTARQMHPQITKIALTSKSDNVIDQSIPYTVPSFSLWVIPRNWS